MSFVRRPHIFIGLEACVRIEDDCSYKMEEQETRKKRPATFTTEDDCSYKLSIVTTNYSLNEFGMITESR